MKSWRLQIQPPNLRYEQNCYIHESQKLLQMFDSDSTDYTFIAKNSKRGMFTGSNQCSHGETKKKSYKAKKLKHTPIDKNITLSVLFSGSLHEILFGKGFPRLDNFEGFLLDLNQIENYKLTVFPVYSCPNTSNLVKIKILYYFQMHLQRKRKRTPRRFGQLSNTLITGLYGSMMSNINIY